MLGTRLEVTFGSGSNLIDLQRQSVFQIQQSRSPYFLLYISSLNVSISNTGKNKISSSLLSNLLSSICFYLVTYFPVVYNCCYRFEAIKIALNNIQNPELPIFKNPQYYLFLLMFCFNDLYCSICLKVC